MDQVWPLAHKERGGTLVPGALEQEGECKRTRQDKTRQIVSVTQLLLYLSPRCLDPPCRGTTECLCRWH
jgi:hypothetical protein